MVVPLIPSTVGAASTEVHVVRARPGLADARFIMYRLLASDFLQEGVSRFQGVAGLQRVPADFLMDLPILNLHVEEQRRIADFLDDQVTRIDAIILNCELLDVRSQQAFESAIIDRTTYSPAGSAVAMTELPWKPLAASDWAIRPMRSFLRYAKEPVGERWTNFHLLSLTKRGVIRRDIESNFGKFPESFESYQILEPGDLVMCLFDVDETPRTVGLAHERGMVTGAYTRFVWTDPEILGRFVEYSLIGIDDQKAFKSLYTGMRKGIQTGRFLSARLPIPPLARQTAIVEELDERRHNMNAFRTENAARRTLLEERKRVLITAAVTGQMDVTTAKPIGMGKWVPNTGANIDTNVNTAVSAAASIGGI